MPPDPILALLSFFGLFVYATGAVATWKFRRAHDSKSLTHKVTAALSAFIPFGLLDSWLYWESTLHPTQHTNGWLVCAVVLSAVGGIAEVFSVGVACTSGFDDWRDKVYAAVWPLALPLHLILGALIRGTASAARAPLACGNYISDALGGK